jgi:hypothetical protein
VTIGAVNQKRELVSKPIGIVRAERAGDFAQASAHLFFVYAGNGCPRVLTIWKLSSKIDEGTSRCRRKHLLINTIGDQKRLTYQEMVGTRAGFGRP